jgi:predicted dienelactone hydrolase
MDKKLVSIVRYQLAASRREQPIGSSVSPVSEWSCKNFHIDFERAIADLSPGEKQTARLLLQTSTADAAKKMRCSRQSIQLRKKRIQAALVAAGINSDYFSSATGAE